MQHAEFLFISLSLSVIGAFSSCSDASKTTAGDYNVEVTLDTDSTFNVNNLYLVVDNHHDVSFDTLTLNRNRVARYQGVTAGIDELYLMSDRSELCRFYATPHSDINVTIGGNADSLSVEYTSPTDSINGWLKEYVSRIDQQKVFSRNKKTVEILDSLQNSGEMGIRTTLLLREIMPNMDDSLYVRRFLGSVNEANKPDWLLKSIELIYPQLRKSSQYGRLASATFQMNDNTIVLSTASRSDYLLLYFWADYNKSSIDTLKSIAKRIDTDYPNSRLQLLTFCLNAPDSAWWNRQIESLPEVGHHALISTGLADPRISGWNVSDMPYNIMTDMFTNIQHRNVWNKDLENALSRVPKRSTPKTSSKPTSKQITKPTQKTIAKPKFNGSLKKQ